LHTKNLRSKRPSKGLDHVKVGPFLVSKRNGPVTYTLELPPDAKIHPRFHVSLLEPADKDTPLQRTFRYETEEENEFEVERLVKYREIGREEFQDPYFIQEWLVKWKGYPDTENTWEPESNLQNCQQLLKEKREGGLTHYYTGYSPERMAREIKQHKMPANKETLNYLVKKGLMTQHETRKYYPKK
jgi:hypothetical protein